MSLTIAYAEIFQQGLDKVLIQDLTTGWMERNASQVKYNGGDTLRVPKMELDGLADYARASGYVGGEIGLSWETKTFRYDRGRKFLLDAMDVDETNFALTAPTVMGEFVRTKVAPEVDLVRIASIAGFSGVKKEEADLDGEESALAQIKAGISYIREKGYGGQIIGHISYEMLNELELETAGKLQSVTWSTNGIDTRVPSVDGAVLIPTASSKLYDAVKKDNGAIVAGDSANALDLVLMGEDIPLAIAKHAPARIFTPDQNKDADAYVINYRLRHDCFILDNKKDAIYVLKKK